LPAAGLGGGACRGVVALLGAAVLTAAAAGRAEQPAPRPNPAAKLKLIPWVECNWPQQPEQDAPGVTQFERTVAGLLIWRQVTDTAIVGTTPGNADLYPELQKRLAGMRIIPGIKTMRLLRRFDSIADWALVAREVRRIQARTGTKVIVFDHERAVEAYVRGQQPLNFDNLRVALAQLPGDLEYIWYPSVFWFIARQPGHQRLVKLCEVVQASLRKLRFVDHRYCGRREVRFGRFINAGKAIDRIARQPTIPLLFFYGPRHQPHIWWLDHQLEEALALVRDRWGPDAEVLIYPGRKRWVEAAQSLSQRLLALRQRGHRP